MSATVSMLTLGLTACSQSPEPVATAEQSEATATPSQPAGNPSSGACAVLDGMEQQFTQSVADFLADPSQDAVVFLENEFNAQVLLLTTTIDAEGADPEIREQLNSDVNTAIEQKDEAIRQFNESTQTDNILQKGVLLAGAVVAAQDAVGTAQSILADLSTQLNCA